VDDLQNLQTRQLKARLESIATAGEILRVSLGASSLESAVRTLLLGLAELVPARALALFEVGDNSLLEMGRLVDGEESPLGPNRPLKEDEPALHALRQHRHTIVERAPSLVENAAEAKSIFIPFEGRLGGEPSEGTVVLRASHLLWIDSPEELPSDVLDTLIALASQGGVLLTGFRYRDDLERTYSALREANGRLQKDIDRAKKIQEGLLPQGIPSVPGLQIAWKYLPAAKVSGDYFDCFPLDAALPDGPHCLVIADVSGHGISASMVMAMFKVLLRREVRPGRPLVDALGRLNRTILDQVGGLHFVTVFLAMVDPAAKTLEWCSAGHCPQLLCHSDGRVEELTANGVFVGMFDDLQASSQIQDLENGDSLLLYTDGITEAENPEGELYGMDRLTQSLRKTGNNPPEARLSSLLQDMNEFSAGAQSQDDLTLVAIQVG
jgi:sigma-B regulation protein RsbU (phosphoserine phosphatase)